MLERMRHEKIIDIYGHVTCLRAQRNYMVQVRYICQKLHDFESGTEEINCSFACWLFIVGTIFVVLRVVPWLRQLVAGLSLWKPRFGLRPFHIVSVVDKAALVQVFFSKHCSLCQYHSSSVPYSVIHSSVTDTAIESNEVNRAGQCT
jgi:hypothetical protein